MKNGWHGPAIGWHVGHWLAWSGHWLPSACIGWHWLAWVGLASGVNGCQATGANKCQRVSTGGDSQPTSFEAGPEARQNRLGKPALDIFLTPDLAGANFLTILKKLFDHFGGSTSGKAQNHFWTTWFGRCKNIFHHFCDLAL